MVFILPMSLHLPRKSQQAFSCAGTAAPGCPQRAGEGACPYITANFLEYETTKKATKAPLLKEGMQAFVAFRFEIGFFDGYGVSYPDHLVVYRRWRIISRKKFHKTPAAGEGCYEERL